MQETKMQRDIRIMILGDKHVDYHRLGQRGIYERDLYRFQKQEQPKPLLDDVGEQMELKFQYKK